MKRSGWILFHITKTWTFLSGKSLHIKKPLSQPVVLVDPVADPLPALCSAVDGINHRVSMLNGNTDSLLSSGRGVAVWPRWTGGWSIPEPHSSSDSATELTPSLTELLLCSQDSVSLLHSRVGTSQEQHRLLTECGGTLKSPLWPSRTTRAVCPLHYCWAPILL